MASFSALRRPDFAVAVVRVEQVRQQVAIVPVGRGDLEGPDQLVFAVDAQVILVTEVGLTVLAGPVGVAVGLLTLGVTATLAALIVVMAGWLVPAERRFNEGGIDDLASSAQIAGGFDLRHQVPEQGVDQVVFNQPLFVHPDGVGVRNGVFQIQAEKAPEGEAVQHLVLGLLQGQVVVVAQEDHLDHQDRVQRRPAALARIGLWADAFQRLPEPVPVHDLVDRHQRILEAIKFGVDGVLVKEAGLHGTNRH